MADTKITGLTAIASLATGDLIPVVDDPSGTPVTTKATMAQVATLMASELVSDTAYASSWNGVTDDAPSKNAVYDKFEARHPGYISGNWYSTSRKNDGNSNMDGVAANTIYYSPFYLSRRGTFSDLGANITTASAGNNVKLAIYAHNATTGRPTGTPLMSTGNISTTSTGFVSAAAAEGNVTFDPGTYWSAFWADNGTVKLAAFYYDGNEYMSHFIGSATGVRVVASGGTDLQGVYSSETFGTWPDAASESYTEMPGVAYNARIAIKAV